MYVVHQLRILAATEAAFSTRPKKNFNKGACQRRSSMHEQPCWFIPIIATRCSTEHNGGHHIGSCMGAAILANYIPRQGVCQIEHWDKPKNTSQSCALVKLKLSINPGTRPLIGVCSGVCDHDNSDDDNHQHGRDTHTGHQERRQRLRLLRLCPGVGSPSHSGSVYTGCVAFTNAVVCITTS